jgi:glyoxylase-like metal-dependent hydrolase (beta-lactamase superfamily II)/ferredoxin
MASPDRARQENVDGDLFVDDTCIDCDTCRWMAPDVFDRRGGMSRVYAQPKAQSERAKALLALVACPTASIGSRSKEGIGEAARAFPIEIEAPVYDCGYHDEHSYGATSYFVQRAEGNILVDVPRFAMPLVKRIEAMGGIHTMFLTHRDDVADHERWAKHFNAKRMMHERDVSSGTRGVEVKFNGLVELAPDLVVIPTPGHTAGSACLLFAKKFLFTGDHLAANDDGSGLIVFDDVCWYSMEEQLRSVAKLRDFDFEWVLPGHGRRAHFDVDRMKRELTTLR